MRISDFEAMVRRFADEVPAEFLEGVAEIAVSPRTVPHPDARTRSSPSANASPLPATDGAEGVQSRVVLYHGSFQASRSSRPVSTGGPRRGRR